MGATFASRGFWWVWPLLIFAAPVAAEAQTLARVSVDGAIAIDQFVGQNSFDRPSVIIDVTAVARLADRWVVYVRPWIRHDPRNQVWNNEIYQAAVQYERPGPIAVRMNAGYIVSPIGLGLVDSRPDVESHDHAARRVPVNDADLRVRFGPCASDFGQLSARCSADVVDDAMGLESRRRQLRSQSAVRHQ